MPNTQFLSKLQLPLNANDGLSDDDRNDVRTRRSTALDELALVDAEIALGNLDIDDSDHASSSSSSTTPCISLPTLRKERRKLLALISACNTALALHKYLPAELLSYIFALTFNGFPTYLPPHKNVSPLVLSHVCSRWRTVALNTPELWTDVVFQYAKTFDPYETMDITEEWFRRSGSSKSLSLVVSHWQGSTGSCRPDHLSVMKAVVLRLIRPHAGRFRHLDLCLAKSELLRLLKTESLLFSKLQSFYFVRDPLTTDNTRHCGLESPFEVLRTAPRLGNVEFRGFKRSFDLHLDLFTWRNITHLRCVETIMTPTQCHFILRNSINIIDCRLLVALTSPDGGTTFTESKLIRLPSLCIFNLEFINPVSDAPETQALAAFFNPFRLPGLKELIISSTNKICSWPRDVLISLISTSCCALEVLQMDSMGLQQSMISALIEVLPTLTVLFIGVDNLLPREILRGMANGDLLPRLECLTCLTDDLETMVQMLEYRCGAASPQSDGALGYGLPESSCAEVARPSFILIEYVGDVINHNQALRVDSLRASGIEIDMTRRLNIIC